MVPLKVWMFGKLRVQHGSMVWSWDDCYKIQQIFCYLMIHRFERHSREHLAELFWLNKPAAASKKYLRQAFWQLQARCAEFLEKPSTTILSTNSVWVCLNPELDVWTDVGAFEQAYDRMRNAGDLDETRARNLQQAVDLYQGDLLEGWYQDWLLCERERLQNMYLAMLDLLIHYCEAHQEYSAGLSYGERILKYDPARERTHQQMMRLKYLVGDRTGAMRQYDRCAKALRMELGVQPGRRTRELLDQIRSDNSLFPPLPDSATFQNDSMSQPTLSELLIQLKGLQTTLCALHQQSQQWIKFIERLDSNQCGEK